MSGGHLRQAPQAGFTVGTAATRTRNKRARAVSQEKAPAAVDSSLPQSPSTYTHAPGRPLSALKHRLVSSTITAAPSCSGACSQDETRASSRLDKKRLCGVQTMHRADDARQSPHRHHGSEHPPRKHTCCAAMRHFSLLMSSGSPCSSGRSSFAGSTANGSLLPAARMATTCRACDRVQQHQQQCVRVVSAAQKGSTWGSRGRQG